MAPLSKAVQLSSDPDANHRMDRKQVLKAANALALHLERSRENRQAGNDKKADLLGDGDEGEKESPIWLVISAKKHLAESNRLMPGKINIPHSLWAARETRICLITADPPASNPKAYKNLVASPEFPAALREKIPKVIAFSRLRAKYKSFESRRQLFAEYDIFLADERIIKILPATLGSVFYKTKAKRPIPVVLSGKKERDTKPMQEQDRAVAKLARKRKFSETGGPESIAVVAFVAKEIEVALSSALVNLSSSPNCEVRVAMAGWSTEWITDNVQAAAERVVEKYVPKKWKNVRSIYIKGQHTAALPIWLAEELWTDEGDIIKGEVEKKAADAEDVPNKRTRLLRNANGAVGHQDKGKKRGFGADGLGNQTSNPAKKTKVETDKAKEVVERKAGWKGEKDL